MILAFCVTDPQSPRQLDERFGRCAAFSLVDSESGAIVETLENPMKDASGSAGVGAVQLLVDHGVTGIVAPHLGPKAADARLRLGLEVWDQGDTGTVEDAFTAWSKGELAKADASPKPKGLYRA